MGKMIVGSEWDMSKHKVEISQLNTSDLKTCSSSEMKELFRRYQNGEVHIKEELVKNNLKLVLSLVQRFALRSDNMDDLFQVGCIGLIKSIDNFDLSQEVRFSTYAVPMILGEIKRYLRDNQMIRVSRNTKDLAYRLFKAKEAYIHEYASEPTLEYLAEKCEVKVKDVVEALDAFQSVISIFEPVYSSDGDEMMLLDQIKDDHNEIEKLQNMMTLKKSLRNLSFKEKDILNKRYFLDLTQSEIAKELGISQAQVSRIEKQAIEVLRKEFE